MVDKDRVAVGRYFKFKEGDRRVVNVENGQVQWVYADMRVRFGAVGGSQRLKHFANEAAEELTTPPSVKAFMSDVLQSALNPRTKADKLVKALSYIAFVLAAPFIIYWIF